MRRHGGRWGLSGSGDGRTAHNRSSVGAGRRCSDGLCGNAAQEALADERAGEVHKRSVQFGPAFPAQPQAPELVPPDPMLAVLNAIGLDPSVDQGYVGDTRTDLDAARAAGLSFAWASYGYGEPVPSAQKVIERFDEVTGL
jgi:hypothetical protein